ncbi:MAG: endonuclease/exonuclease/phosphatase family protein [Kiritimatiellae bacterium]|nr:endonuclease/exonuclease/phosphatase family protein [Kiritimatiellia bacterium]
MNFACALLLAALTVGTWNGEWFPSGRAEHRADAKKEARTIRRAGEMLRRGLDRADPSGTNDLVLCFNEIRGEEEAKALLAAIGRPNLRLAVVSGYRRRDRFDQQQDVIATTLPVVEANWSRWKNSWANTPPRGYAHARVVVSPSVTAEVYAVHLKSNYGQTSDAIAATNRLKRTLAVEQVVEQERPKRGRPAAKVIVAGDFNADRWNGKFREERIFDIFEKAGFMNCIELLPEQDRVTHPGGEKWGDTALDYVMVRGFECYERPVVMSSEGLSDHEPVFVNLR